MPKHGAVLFTILMDLWSLWIILCAWHPEFSVWGWEYATAWIIAMLYIFVCIITSIGAPLAGVAVSSIRKGSADPDHIRSSFLDACKKRSPWRSRLAPWFALVTIATVISMAQLGWTAVAITTGVTWVITKPLTAVWRDTIKELREVAIDAEIMTWEELGFPPEGPT